MLILLLMNFVVGLSSFLLNYRILKSSNFLDSIISWIIIYFGQIVFSELLLGVLGILYLNNVIMLNLAILVSVWLITKNKDSSFNLYGLKENVILLLKNKVILLGSSIIIGFALVKIFINFINPPVGWDSLNYHFTFPVEWLKHGNLDMPITISDDPSPSYYPINGSLLFLWLIFSFRSVFLADISQLPFFIMAFLAVYRLSRKLSLSKELSLYAASIFFITPNFFKQLSIAYVDVMVAALFLASINFLLEFNRSFKLRDCVLWALSFGLFMGTKTSGVVFGLLPFAYWIFIFIKNANKLRFNKILVMLLLFVLFATMMGGFSYIKNFIQTGNPLYPVDIELFGKRVFRGVMPFSTYRNRWTKEELDFEKLVFHEGLGAQFLLLVLPATFLSMPLFLIRRRKYITQSFIPLEKTTDFNLRSLPHKFYGGIKPPSVQTVREQDSLTGFIFLLSLPIYLYLSFWWLMPQLWVRYLYPFLGIGSLVGIYFLELLNIPKKFIKLIVVICLLASMGELAKRWELIVSIILSLSLFILLPNLIKKISFNFKRITIATLLIIILIQCIKLNYDKYEFKRYLLRSRFPQGEKESWAWLNDNTDKNRIAYVGRPDVLPLYGSNFKNDVIYVSVNKTHPAKLHYFRNARYIWTKDFITLHQNLEKPGNYRQNADYEVWLTNLNSEKIDYLVIYSLHQVKYEVFPVEDFWAKQHPEKFNLVFNNRDAHIYKVLK